MVIFHLGTWATKEAGEDTRTIQPYTYIIPPGSSARASCRTSSLDALSGRLHLDLARSSRPRLARPARLVRRHRFPLLDFVVPLTSSHLSKSLATTAEDQSPPAGYAGPLKEGLDLTIGHVGHDLPPFQPGGEWLGLPELPTPAELNPDGDADSIAASVMRHLGENDVSRPYGSKEEYLETHYRLNREEGITFLRLGVSEYKRNPLMMDNDNTCVYTKVFVQGYLMTKIGPVCRIQFSTQRAGKRIRWTTSQRLTPGTIVAISTATDNFKSICKTAVVADRPIRAGLEKKPPTIEILWADTTDIVIDPTQELVMIESRRGYFEAVRHTLVALQQAARLDSPMTKYLVEGSGVDGEPSYITNNSRMDLTPLLHRLPEDPILKGRLLRSYENYNVLGGIPSDIGQYTSLDNSQLQAVHRILTKELAIVQGPPGTGKTYTSVQSLRCMVSTLTAGMIKAPEEVIIVSAETNHAVDQILTHLVGSGIKVVRLGGRTRDDEIKKQSLFNLRQRVQSGRDKNMNTLEAARKRCIDESERVLSEVLPREPLDSNLLLERGIITKEQFDSLSGDEWTWQPGPGKPGGVISEWLGDHLEDISACRTYDPVFDNEEIFEEGGGDGADTSKFELDADDPTIDDDSIHLKGTWVGVNRQWGGANPNNIALDNAQIPRQLRKQNLWEIEQKWRGPIYEYWLLKLLKIGREALCDIFAKYKRVCDDIKTNGWARDVRCIKLMNIQIIGCTTTGLSKYRGLLAALKPKTILIEEAAQSREAHVAAALLPSLQQLILVGDHQQLVPHCDVPGLAGTFHNLTVSMFERLVSHLQLPFTVLIQQRRMVPEIRALLNPFYPDLGDHPVVWDKAHRPAVPGMVFNSYLFDHDWEEGTDVETLSKYNLKEAEMVIQFARYLMQNGVLAEQITILTFYRGQRKKILMLARKCLTPDFGHSNINVCTVDSYQGEENDIILLSLVRSVPHNRPAVAGFVGDMNRGVVSISRARRGLYIFGNIQNLARATETSRFMWGNVRATLDELNRYDAGSSHLPLLCQNHGKVTYAAGPNDLKNRYGGCEEKCTGVFQPCGHSCEQFCHPKPHENLTCQHDCKRKLQCGHVCDQKCGDKCCCGKKCAEFMSQMKRPTLPGQSGTPGQSNNSVLVPTNNWSTYVAAHDDANRRTNVPKTAPNTDVLGQSVQSTPTNVRDEYRQISVGMKGQRKVGENVVARPAVNVNKTPSGTITAGDQHSRTSSGQDVTPTPTHVARRAPQNFSSTLMSHGTMPQLAGYNDLANRVLQAGRGAGSARNPNRGPGRGGNQGVGFGRNFMPPTHPSFRRQGEAGGLPTTYGTARRQELASQGIGNTQSRAETSQPSPGNLTMDVLSQQVNRIRTPSPDARTVKDWEESTDDEEEEPLDAKLRRMNLEAAANPPGAGEEDLITF
ncbi:helicase required for RNAi-mediated heterochromatin assembly 1 [Seiridium cupressi]